MKRLVLSIAIITAVFSASAQTFVKPELKKEMLLIMRMRLLRRLVFLWEVVQNK